MKLGNKLRRRLFPLKTSNELKDGSEIFFKNKVNIKLTDQYSIFSANTHNEKPDSSEVDVIWCFCFPQIKAHLSNTTDQRFEA